MQSIDGSEFERCLFVSPVLDMERLIQDMMQWAGVSEERLKKESLIPAGFGETLLWEYYGYAKAYPVTRWRCRTDVLYAGKDNMTTRKTVDEFAERFHSTLTVMENGEHWFHTPEQLAVLNRWVMEVDMRSVKEVAGLTGISVRTLQYYDEIGIFKPTSVTDAGYRMYNEEALNTLQQILFLKSLIFL